MINAHALYRAGRVRVLSAGNARQAIRGKRIISGTPDHINFLLGKIINLTIPKYQTLTRKFDRAYFDIIFRRPIFGLIGFGKI
jgi:hypothetical protein